MFWLNCHHHGANNYTTKKLTAIKYSDDVYTHQLYRLLKTYSV